MNILIIGCNGFIGKALTEYYLLKGYTVFGCDILESIERAPYSFILIDPLNIDYQKIFKHNTFDLCIYAAGAANVSASIIDPLNDYKNNVIYFFYLLEAIRLFNPTCKTINLSSAAVYGNKQYLPINETHPTNPISPYGWHKYQSEILCREYNQTFNLKTCSLRVFSAYGPGLKKQIIWDLYKKTKDSTTINLYGTGEESRDFIFIDDLVRAIDIVFHNAPFEAETINIANGEEVQIKNLIKTYLEILNKHTTVVFTDNNRNGDPLNWKADIQKISNWGYKKQVDLKTGIQNSLNWYKQNDN
jgi:UDP-glucose 4-epimerase